MEYLGKQEQSIEYWKQKCAELEQLLKVYQEQLRLYRHRQYGRSSERHELLEQPSLFDEESSLEISEPETEITTVTYTRRKHKGKRKEDLSGLPVERVEYELDEEERMCPECGGVMHVMGYDVRREVEIIPAQFKVIEHARATYACRHCEKHNDHVPIKKAQLPTPVISGSIASPSALAHIMTQKYVNAMPLYRQEQDFARNGFILSRQTMANWMIKVAETWLEPLFKELKRNFLQRQVAHADETTMQVLKEPGRAPGAKSYMWLYQTSSDTKQPIILYDYQRDRSWRHPKDFLEEFSGYLHTDGYAAYHHLPPNITIVGCWQHVRRKFEEAWKILPKEDRTKLAAEKGIAYCQKLFNLERVFATMIPKERYEQRLQHSKPVAEAFCEWAKTCGALPKSALGQAVGYLLKQKSYLMNVFLDGRLELSNNRAERSVKPVVIGRKNWLFCNTPAGAKASAIIYSIAASAMANGLNPFQYLKYLFEKMPNSKDPIETYLPWNETIPAYCKMPERKSNKNGDKKYRLHDELCERVS